jgi:cell division ATPase FtsA
MGTNKDSRMAETKFDRKMRIKRPLRLKGLSRLAADFARHVNFAVNGTSYGIYSIIDNTRCSTEVQRDCGRVVIELYKIEQTPAGAYLKDYNSGRIKITSKETPDMKDADEKEKKKIMENLRKNPFLIDIDYDGGMEAMGDRIGYFNFSKYSDKKT